MLPYFAKRLERRLLSEYVFKAKGPIFWIYAKAVIPPTKSMNKNESMKVIALCEGCCGGIGGGEVLKLVEVVGIVYVFVIKGSGMNLFL